MSDRVTLRRGDTFRAKGGPYYLGADGKRTKMVERGALKFVAYCERDGQRWIEAYSASGGGFTILSLTDRESVLPGSYVPRPYRIAPAKREQERLVEADPADIAKGGGKPDKQARRAAKRAAGVRRQMGSLRGAARAALRADAGTVDSQDSAPGLAPMGLLGGSIAGGD